jgi:DNA-directed RNA polymerase alpha subunit
LKKNSEIIEPEIRSQLYSKLSIALDQRNQDRCYAMIDWYFAELAAYDDPEESPPLELVGIPDDIADAFYAQGICSVAQLIQHSVEELRVLPQIGPKSITVITEALKSHGYALRFDRKKQ